MVKILRSRPLPLNDRKKLALPLDDRGGCSLSPFSVIAMKVNA
ncbi:MAG: hypothetical protein WAO23_03530 [Dethiobacteria bacterium]